MQLNPSWTGSTLEDCCEWFRCAVITVQFRYRVLTEDHRAFLLQARGTTLGGTTIAWWKEEALPIQLRCTILTGTLTLRRIQIQLVYVHRPSQNTYIVFCWFVCCREGSDHVCVNDGTFLEWQAFIFIGLYPYCSLRFITFVHHVRASSCSQTFFFFDYTRPVGEAPDYITQAASTFMFEDLEDCCETYYWWVLGALFLFCMQHVIAIEGCRVNEPPLLLTWNIIGGIWPSVWDWRLTLVPTNTTLTTDWASVSKTALIVIAEGSSEEYGMNSTTISLCAVPRNSGG